MMILRVFVCHVDLGKKPGEKPGNSHDGGALPWSMTLKYTEFHVPDQLWSLIILYCEQKFTGIARGIVNGL